MQKDPGEKRVGVFQEPNRRQPHLDFRTSTPFMKTRQAQSVYGLVCSRLNNPTKHMRLVCFPYLGQVGFPRFLCIADLREFLIGPVHKKKTTSGTSAEVGRGGCNEGGWRGGHMRFPFFPRIVPEHWAWHGARGRKRGS